MSNKLYLFDVNRYHHDLGTYQIRMAIRFQLTGAWVVILPLVVLGVAPPWAGFVVSAALLVATWSMPYQPELQDYLMEDSR